MMQLKNLNFDPFFLVYSLWHNFHFFISLSSKFETFLGVLGIKKLKNEEEMT